MIAVIETGGKQYIVKKGDVITVDRLDETLDKHTFTPLLIADEDGGTKIGAPLVEGAAVHCTVREHVRDDKVRVFKMKPKKLNKDLIICKSSNLIIQKKMEQVADVPAGYFEQSNKDN